MAPGRSIAILVAFWPFSPFSAGCSPASQGARTASTVLTPPLAIPRLERTAPRPEPATLRFDGEGAASPTGCFAVSRRTGAIACVVGQYAAASDDGERRVTLLASGQGESDLPLHVQTAGGRTTPPLASASRIALDALMRSGDFVALDPPAALLGVEAFGDYGNLSVELHAVSGGGISRSDLQVLVRSRAIAAPENDPSRNVLLENLLSDVTCTVPQLAIRRLEPARLLIERTCELADGSVVASAWLCDDDRDRCE